jgi:hypothetical protein
VGEVSPTLQPCRIEYEFLQSKIPKRLDTIGGKSYASPTDMMCPLSMPSNKNLKNISPTSANAERK